MKIQIYFLAVFLLGISCAPLPEEAGDPLPVQKEEQKVTGQLPIDELNTKELRKEQKPIAADPQPELRNAQTISILENTKKINEKSSEDKIEEPKALPVEGKKAEEINVEEPKAFSVEEEAFVSNIKLKSKTNEKEENELIEPVVALSKSVGVEIQSSVAKENIQVIESKSVSLEEFSKNELYSSDKKLNVEEKQNKEDSLTPKEKNSLESVTKREEKKVEEEEKKKSKETANKSIEEKSSEKNEKVDSNESNQESAESDESKE